MDTQGALAAGLSAATAANTAYTDIYATETAPRTRRAARESLLTALPRAALVVWLVLGLLLILRESVVLLRGVFSVVVPPLVLAGLVVLVLHQPVNVLARRMSRALATGLTMLVAVTILAGIAVVLVPPVLRQAGGLIADTPGFVASATDNLERWGDRVGVDLPLSRREQRTELPAEAEEAVAAGGASATVLAVLGGLTGVATGLVGLVVTLVVGTVLGCYIVADMPHLSAVAHGLVPPAWREDFHATTAEIRGALLGFARGQLLVAIFVGLLSAIGLALAGLPGWGAVGVVAGVTNLIPLVGPISAAVVGGVIALAHFGIVRALVVVAIMILVQQIDSHVLSPRIIGASVNVHPVTVLIALLLGGSLFGLLGVLLAVPIAATGQIVAGRLWRRFVPWGDDVSAEPRRGIDEA